MLAPVVIFVYNRPEHTRLTIEALAKNSLADETEVYIYSDAPKKQNTEQKVEMVRKYIDDLVQLNIFKSLRIIKAENNKGLARSVISGVNEIIGRYGKVIVVEDDLICAPDFLRFMNGALDFYARDNRIWSICGYTFKMNIPLNYKHNIYLSYRGGSWGWATWRDRWERVDWEVTDYPRFKKEKRLRSRFNRGGCDMANMLDNQMKGIIDSWAIRWCYAQSKLDMLTVYPVVSRVKNIGLDGTGTHSVINSKYNTVISNGTDKCRFERLDLDRRIVKSFRDHFGTEFDCFVSELKSYVKKLLSVKKNNRRL